RSSDNLLFCCTPEMERVFVNVYTDTINLYLLTHISRDDVSIITVLPQVVILCFRRTICQIQSLTYIGLNNFVIRMQRKEVVMKHPDMVSCLYGNIVLAAFGVCLQGFAVC